MESQNGDSFWGRRCAGEPLAVIVVGAGIAGLAIGLCMRKIGHDVQILEKRGEASEIGAGIQLAPNATRILRRLGVLDKVMKYATELEGNSLRRWENDEELGAIPFADVKEHYGAPLAVIHRADLQSVLLNAALECGCHIVKNREVVNIDQGFLPTDLGIQLIRRNKGLMMIQRIQLRINGEEVWVSADLIIAADGMNSFVRRRMAEAGGHDDHLIPAGELAYRFLLPVEQIRHDEAVAALLRKSQGMRYVGPGGHVMAYPLRGSTLYNVVLVRVTKDGNDKEGPQQTTLSWTKEGSKEEILEYYRGWCPAVRALIGHAPSSGILETPMNNMPPLPTWVMGRIALAGDACHYMLPYVAQGASNALEDAATLAVALTCTDDIDLALELYQTVRKERSERMQASAETTGRALHLPDGENQQRRDEAFRAASQGVLGVRNPDQWNDKKSHEFMWRVDVMKETVDRFQALTDEHKRLRTDGPR